MDAGLTGCGQGRDIRGDAHRLFVGGGQDVDFARETRQLRGFIRRCGDVELEVGVEADAHSFFQRQSYVARQNAQCRTSELAPDQGRVAAENERPAAPVCFAIFDVETRLVEGDGDEEIAHRVGESIEEELAFFDFDEA